MKYINDNYIDEYITRKLVEENTKNDSEHKSSGKLSAGMLGKPLQWNILKTLGIPQKPLDPYVLRKFQRGKDVETWFISQIPNLIETQKFLEYKNCIGYCDAIVDTSTFNFKCGNIPHEVKSVTNAKFKMIKKDGNADRSHILQCALYALALGTENFAIDYIASDDYRITTMIYNTQDYKIEIDNIIDTFYKQLATGKVPVFEPCEKWQSNKEYSDYPEWQDLTEEEIVIKLKEYETNIPNR